MSRTIKILSSIWPRTRKFSQLLRAKQGRQLLLTFLAMDTRWSRSTSNFYVLICQNLTGEFMLKVYAASENLFTLTAEADKVLGRHLLMFLTAFFHWMYKIKYNCHQDSSVIHGSFVYWVFGWEMRRLSKIGNPISHGVVFVFHLAWCVRGLISLKRWWLLAAASRLVRLSNYCIWCLLVSFPVLDCEVERCLCG